MLMFWACIQSVLALFLGVYTRIHKTVDVKNEYHHEHVVVVVKVENQKLFIGKRR
jgi:hypothetical protein